MKKEDLRVIKTKKNLQEALLFLLKDNMFENIKVSDICLKANINRSTFYDHFTDKYELLYSLCDSIQLEFSNNDFELDSFSSFKDYYLKICKSLLDHFKSNFDVYYSIYSNNNNSVSFDTLISIISENVYKAIDRFSISLSVPIEFYVSYYVGAMISVCKMIFFNKNLYSVEDIMIYLDSLICI